MKVGDKVKIKDNLYDIRVEIPVGLTEDMIANEGNIVTITRVDLTRKGTYHCRIEEDTWLRCGEYFEKYGFRFIS